MPKTASEVKVERGKAAPAAPSVRQSPFGALRHEIDRLFDDFDWPPFRLPSRQRAVAAEPAWSWPDSWAVSPPVDLVERKEAFEVVAELPGLSAEDVEVRLSDGMLTIKGEKTTETTEEKADFHLRERSYGSFQRLFRLPEGIDADKVDARFDNGVLTVRLPKTAEAREKERKIEVKAA